MSNTKVDNQVIVDSLRHSVAKALERKRCLGQYAIVSKDGKLTRLDPQDIEPIVAAEAHSNYNLS